MEHVTIKCPICAKKVEWIKTNRFFPFCSELCQHVDFNAWANGCYLIEDKNIK